MNLSMIPPDQAAVAGRFLEAQCERRRHLVVYLSGSHSYGFASPDSDLDLKAIHIAPTRQLVGLRTTDQTANRLEVIDGVEIDYTSNELGPVLAGVLGGNGNYLERILGELVVIDSPELAPLRPLAHATLSRRAARHYAGFATSQRKALDSSAAPTAKKVLYVLRTALTGIHLMQTGVLVPDITRLLDDHGFGAARELIEIKQAGERTALLPEGLDRWRSELDRAMALLEAARTSSPLPDEPPAAAVADLDAWLLELRRAAW
jgi:uncharacterized protein